MGATLAARVLEGFWAGYYVVNVRSGANVVLFDIPLDIDAPYHLDIAGIFPSDVNFPYGFVVASDERP